MDTINWYGLNNLKVKFGVEIVKANQLILCEKSLSNLSVVECDISVFIHVTHYNSVIVPPSIIMLIKLNGHVF